MTHQLKYVNSFLHKLRSFSSKKKKTKKNSCVRIKVTQKQKLKVEKSIKTLKSHIFTHNKKKNTNNSLHTSYMYYI